MRKIFYVLLFGFGAAFSDDTDYPEVDIFLLFKVIKIQYAHKLLEIIYKVIRLDIFKYKCMHECIHASLHR